MKKQLVIRFSVLLYLLIASVQTYAQTWVSLDGSPSDKAYTVEVLKSDASIHQAKVTIHGFYDRVVKIGSEEYHKIILPEASETQDVGCPQLPVIPQLIAIPEGAGYRVSVEEGQWKDVPTGKVYPAQSDVKESAPEPEFQINEVAYRNVLEKTPLVSIGSEQVWRHIRNMGLYLLPFRYDPIGNKLSALTEFIFTICFDGASSHSKVRKKDIADAVNWRMFSNRIEYFPIEDKSIRSASSSDDYDYLIIVGNLPEILNSQTLQDFCKWKAFKGYKTKVVSTAVTGITPESIKNYIAQEFDNGVRYVLFIGDSDMIPLKTVNILYEYSHGDYWYGCIDSNYYHQAAISVGRFSTNSLADFQNMVNKTIMYERSFSGNSYKTLLVAHKQNPNNLYYYRNCCEDIRATYDPPLQIDTLYGAYGATNFDVITHINNGTHIVNYRGHGESDHWGLNATGSNFQPWNNYNEFFEASEIVNIDTCSIYFNICCQTGNITEEPCMMETFTRSPKGAIACIAATEDMYRFADNRFNKTLYSLLVDSGVYNIGDLNVQAQIGTIHAQPEAWDVEPSTAVARAIFNALSYLCGGDPTLELWTGEPQMFSEVKLVRIGSSLTISSPAFVAGDKISIVSADGELVQKLTMSGTSCTFSPPASNFYITVNRHNYYPYIVYCSSDNYIQNETIESNYNYHASPLSIGYDVTTDKPYGNVMVKSGANLSIQNGSGGVTIKSGFECEKGAMLIVE